MRDTIRVIIPEVLVRGTNAHGQTFVEGDAPVVALLAQWCVAELVHQGRVRDASRAIRLSASELCGASEPGTLALLREIVDHALSEERRRQTAREP